jgi:sigma-B regulation protein RsbQ
MDRDILARNNVTVFGKGAQPMMFAHGFGCDQNVWRFVTPAFEEKYRIVLFDHVGCGKSDIGAYDPQRYKGLDAYAEDVLDICGALDLKDIIFVGHSVGCMIGLLASIRDSRRFDRLLLVAPSPCHVNHPPDYVGGLERKDIVGLLDLMDKNYMGWAHTMAPLIMKNAERPELAHELGESFCSTDPVTARGFAEVSFLSDNRDLLAQTRVPSLIMQCADDMLAPLEVGDYLQRHLPQSTLRRMHATGHCPHLSRPEEVVAAIADYLAIPHAGSLAQQERGQPHG